VHRLALVVALLLAPSVSAPAADGATSLQSPQPPRSGKVAVYRGGTAASGVAASGAAARGAAAPVRIFRGSAAPPGYLTRPAVSAPAAEPIGGERLWLIDRARDRLVGCKLARTVDVGRNAVRCADRRLPGG